MLFILILVSAFGCADISKKSAQNEQRENINAAEISKDEAVEIAKRYISSDYDVEYYMQLYTTEKRIGELNLFLKMNINI